MQIFRGEPEDCGDVSLEPRYDERFVLTASFCPQKEGTLAIETGEKAGGGQQKTYEKGRKKDGRSREASGERREGLARDGMRKLARRKTLW